MDFVNVKDIVQANITGMESDIENEIFNVGTGVSTSIRDLAYLLIDFAGKDVKPIFRPGIELVTERRADVGKAKELLGFKAEIDIKKGLREVAEDIAAHPDRY